MKDYNEYVNFLIDNELFLKTRNRSLSESGSSILSKLVQEFFFSRILEIGRSKGHSFGLFRFFSPNSHVVSIDIVDHPEAFEVANLFDSNYLFINGTSSKARDLGYCFDMIFIDGDHTYDGCLFDWEVALEVSSNNCLVVFDDLDHPSGCGRVFDDIQVFDKKVFYCDGDPVLGIVRIKK